jgi:hypothetical protein
MKNLLTLCDDGTMDTVFQCEHCSSELRYSDVERDSEGYIPEEEISRLSAEHADECEGPEDLSHGELASRWHSGQWSPLYAFLSTGTVTEGLSSEILSCIPHAEKNSHENEVQALKEFQEWAESEESKKFPTE